MNAPKKVAASLFDGGQAARSLNDLHITGYDRLKRVSLMSATAFAELDDDDRSDDALFAQPTFHENIAKIRLIYDSLTDEQKLVFRYVHAMLSGQGGECVYIDAGPGTGKTHLIASIAATTRRPCCYLVYTNSLAAQLAEVRGVESYTCCKFLMKTLNLGYYEARNLWTSAQPLTDRVHAVLRLAERFRADSPLVILDEYAVVSPWLIVFLYCASIRHGFRVLFVGDRNQQSSIDKSAHHRQTNHTLLRALCVKGFALNATIRQLSDAAYAQKLRSIATRLSAGVNDTSMDFAIKYDLFALFERQFFMRENFDALYMAQYHADIKRRIERHGNAAGCQKAGFCKKADGGAFVDIDLSDETFKFHPYLCLIVGAKYIYTTPARLKRIVTFLGTTSAADAVVVRDVSTGRVFTLSRVRVHESFVHPDHLTWLKQRVDGAVYQYPLRFYASTYHAAQGLTLDVDRIELNVDASTLNSVYVGLSRVRTESQLGKLHSCDLANFLVTRHFDDGYFYKLCASSRNLVTPNDEILPSLVDGLVFKVVNDRQRFRTKNVLCDMKIARDRFANEPTEPPADTDLTAVCRMLKENKRLLFGAKTAPPCDVTNLTCALLSQRAQQKSLETAD